MKKKTQAEILENKLGNAKIYRLLMICFLVIAIVSSTWAIISAVRFTNFKDGLNRNGFISIVLQTKKMPDTDVEIPKEYQLNIGDYENGDGLIDASWKGKTLDEFLRTLPNLFQYHSSGYIDGIKGSRDYQNKTGTYWMLYSPTDPSSADNPDSPAPNGAPFMYLQSVNVYYFALHK